MKPHKKVEKEYYVNNKDFYNALVQYQTVVSEAKASGKKIPQIPDYICDCFIRIANRLSYKYNFTGYTYRDDMISDGIENEVKSILNFDSQYTNPFSYFTEIVYKAFVRKIQREKKQLYIKCLSLRDVLSECEENTIPKQNNYYTQVSDEFIEQYELSKAEKKKRKKNPVLVIDEFLVDLEKDIGGEK